MELVRCIDCSKFPWRRDHEDYGHLPVAVCDPKLDAQIWRGQSASVERDCPFFVATEAQIEDVLTEAETVNDLTVEEIENLVTEVDEETLMSLLEQERSGKNRKTAVAAIEQELKERAEGNHDE